MEDTPLRKIMCPIQLNLTSPSPILVGLGFFCCCVFLLVDWLVGLLLLVFFGRAGWNVMFLVWFSPLPSS